MVWTLLGFNRAVTSLPLNYGHGIKAYGTKLFFKRKGNKVKLTLAFIFNLGYVTWTFLASVSMYVKFPEIIKPT